MTDYAKGKATGRSDSAARSCVVPLDGTAPAFVPTAILCDADGTVTGWLKGDDTGTSARVFPVLKGLVYPLRLVKVSAVSGVAAIIGLSG